MTTPRRFIDATRDAAWTRAARQRAEAVAGYRPRDEHDACGVGLVAAIDGRARREVVTLALAALKNVWHRGAVDADGKTGDGAGLRLDVPDAFFREQAARTGHAPRPGPVGVGMVFLPRTDFAAQELARTIVESEVLREGLYIYGWRQVPVRPDVIGEKAEANRPEIEQILFHDPQGRDFETLEKLLFLVRRRIERRALETGVDVYICSLSTRTLVYKGMFLAEQIESFYPDLSHEGFISRAAIFHQRYSTNTFPEWRLAQPFRILAHNGEINTLKGNVNWMTSHEIGLARDAFGDNALEVRPIIQRGSSDSAAYDQTFEALVRGGREAPFVKALTIPEAWSKRSDRMPAARRDLYAYCTAMMEPWDGPAAIAACDGRWAIAGLDRNGLRPVRWARTDDGILAVGSEAGMCPLDDERVIRRGAIAPGGMIGVDLVRGEFYEGHELVDHIAASRPFSEWIARTRDLEPEVGRGPEPVLYEAPERRRRLRAAGVTREDLEVVLAPMIDDRKEAVGSMGDDTPLAVLSVRYRPLSHYFRQNFSQVTNPPIDPLREGRVMSLRTRFQNLGAIRAGDGPLPEVFALDGPILTNGMHERLLDVLGQTTSVIDCTFPRPNGAGAGQALREALDRIRAEAIEAV
ncbi:MAG: glutamate synthase large subunit, partial [Caulobacterales bacterium]|nr:glutamate synthase large subunit [Caulobacterales bacterium]